MRFVAQETRQLMAKLGMHSIQEMCGRTDLLKFKNSQGFSRAGLLDVSRIIVPVSEEWKGETQVESARLESSKIEKALEKLSGLSSGTQKDMGGTYSVNCVDRAVGTVFGSKIQEKFGSKLDDDAYVLNFTGGAGQSFGAFIPKGLTLKLNGDANDAVGKGLSGGKIVIKPSADFEGVAEQNIIVGNVAFFGATSGYGFINGIAGERFGVRNSGATIVTEGCGDHGLEYMTGGFAVILGQTGKNLCAGMSGGVAYVLDEDHDLYTRLNTDLVTMYKLDDKTTALKTDGSGQNPDVQKLYELIENHAKETGSIKAKKILADWPNYIGKFKKVIPDDYLSVLTRG